MRDDISLHNRAKFGFQAGVADVSSGIDASSMVFSTPGTSFAVTWAMIARVCDVQREPSISFSQPRGNPPCDRLVSLFSSIFDRLFCRTVCSRFAELLDGCAVLQGVHARSLTHTQNVATRRLTLLPTTIEVNRMVF